MLSYQKKHLFNLSFDENYPLQKSSEFLIAFYRFTYYNYA